MGVKYKQRTMKDIDISNHATRRDELARELVSAAKDIGFFYVTGHGISQAEIDAQFATARRFLELPEEKRAKVVSDKQNMAYILGWSQEKLQKGGTMRSAMLVGYDHGKMKDLWPSDEDCPGFKQETLDFMFKCHEVTKVIMGCLALGLGLPEDHFYKEMDPKHEDIATGFYLNRYPSVENREILPGVLRIWAHTDFEILTLLFQRKGEVGLEVLPGREAEDGKAQSEGVWTPFDPHEGAITVNIGDALQYWTDDELKSTFHRVRVPRGDEYQGDRYSMAYFANCRSSTVLQGPAKKHPAITFPDILRAKANGPLKRSEEMSDEETARMHAQTAQGPGFILADATGDRPAQAA